MSLQKSCYISQNLAPTLCWENQSDPNGDELEYYAEAHSSVTNVSSGWIRDTTCWRPSQLDYQYESYQWHVKARDLPAHSESSWSDTWTFIVAAPNRPPSISFNTANGVDFTTTGINSRTRNWTFAGTASDPEGQLNRVEIRCSGDNCGYQAGHSNGGNWSHTQNDMAGQNDVYFVAYDDAGYSSSSRLLILQIDLAAPTTRLFLNNESTWPTWFTGPAQVRLNAVDEATGWARVGVREIHYRVDGGAWQTQAGDTATFAVNSDGAHSVEYYSVDRVDNVEATRVANFQIDQTPPSPPSGIGETHGVAHDQWQKASNAPTFTWSPSTDATSGVWGYQFYTAHGHKLRFCSSTFSDKIGR